MLYISVFIEHYKDVFELYNIGTTLIKFILVKVPK